MTDEEGGEVCTLCWDEGLTTWTVSAGVSSCLWAGVMEWWWVPVMVCERRLRGAQERNVSNSWPLPT